VRLGKVCKCECVCKGVCVCASGKGVHRCVCAPYGVRWDGGKGCERAHFLSLAMTMGHWGSYSTGATSQSSCDSPPCSFDTCRCCVVTYPYPGTS
jgi:hypothetical protein